MKNFLKKNLILIIAFALPILFISAVAIYVRFPLLRFRLTMILFMFPVKDRIHMVAPIICASVMVWLTANWS